MSEEQKTIYPDTNKKRQMYEKISEELDNNFNDIKKAQEISRRTSISIFSFIITLGVLNFISSFFFTDTQTVPKENIIFMFPLAALVLGIYFYFKKDKRDDKK